MHVGHYDLTLDYDILPNTLRAHAVLETRVLESCSALSLDLAGLTVDRVLVNGRPVSGFRCVGWDRVGGTLGRRSGCRAAGRGAHVVAVQ